MNTITPVQFLNLLAGDDTVTALDYKVEWANGTGYFDGLCREQLEPGKLYSSRDQHGRTIIAIATSAGVVVAFQRYSDNDDVVAWCGDTTILQALGAKPAACTDELARILGYQVGHTGDKLYHMTGRFDALCQLLENAASGK